MAEEEVPHSDDLREHAPRAFLHSQDPLELGDPFLNFLVRGMECSDQLVLLDRFHMLADLGVGLAEEPGDHDILPIELERAVEDFDGFLRAPLLQDTARD